jgi:prepilin-type N-terminal cleavage/methylation domain-containing protein
MRRTLGFTLIEVMIAVVIIAILTAIAHSSYLDYVGAASAPRGSSSCWTSRSARSSKHSITVLTRLRLQPSRLRAYCHDGARRCCGQVSGPVITVTAGPPPTFRIALLPHHHRQFGGRRHAVY